MSFDTESVLAVAAAQIADDPDAGASLCVMLDGQVVAAGCWGLADARRHMPYTQSSLHISMSMAKGVVAGLLAMLVDRGAIDPSERVAHYWPEFATPSKHRITVEQLMSHQAGLPVLEGGFTIAAVADRAGMADKFARQDPLWEPGTAFGYHAMTFGSLADLLFEKAAGLTVADLLAEVSQLLDIEIHAGLPHAQWDRAVRMLMPRGAVKGFTRELREYLEANPTSLDAKLMYNVPEVLEDADAFYNGEGLRQVFMPAANMFTNARSLARFYAALAAGGSWHGRRLCSPEALAAVTRTRVRGPDVIGRVEAAFGLGFQKPSPGFAFSPNPEAFGHGGAGGSIAFADPDARLALAWMPTRMDSTHPSPRALAIIRAVYDALG